MKNSFSGKNMTLAELVHGLMDAGMIVNANYTSDEDESPIIKVNGKKRVTVEYDRKKDTVNLTCN